MHHLKVALDLHTALRNTQEIKQLQRNRITLYIKAGQFDAAEDDLYEQVREKRLSLSSTRRPRGLRRNTALSPAPDAIALSFTRNCIPHLEKLADLRTHKGDYHGAIVLYETVLRLKTTAWQQHNTLHQLAVVLHTYMGRTLPALDYNRRALSIARKTRHPNYHTYRRFHRQLKEHLNHDSTA